MNDEKLMPYGQAIDTLLHADEMQSTDILRAIEKITSMLTINATPKDALFNGLKFLWEQHNKAKQYQAAPVGREPVTMDVETVQTILGDTKMYFCPGCHAVLSASFCYCPTCGLRVRVPEEEDDEDGD